LPHVHGLALECERSVPGNDEAPSNSRQITCQVFGYAIGEVVLARIATQVPKGQHNDRETRRLCAVCSVTWKEARAHPPRSCRPEENQERRHAPPDPTPAVRYGGAPAERGDGLGGCARNVELIDPHRLLDVLDLPLAHILEGDRQLAADLIVDGTGNEHATRLGQRLQPGRDVDPVTVDPVLVVDHIPQIDADAKQHAATLRHPLVTRRHPGLDLDRALGGADHAGKLSHDAVAGGVDDPPTVPADQRQDHALMGLEVPHGGGLIRVHEPAVAGDVGGKNPGEPTPYRGLLVHG
jgi:hypothetical protein